MMAFLKQCCCRFLEEDRLSDYLEDSQKWANGIYQQTGNGFKRLYKLEAKVKDISCDTKVAYASDMRTIFENIAKGKEICGAIACSRAKTLIKRAEEWNAPNIWESGKTLEELNKLIQETDDDDKELSYPDFHRETFQAYRAKLAAVRGGLIGIKNLYKETNL